jgi:hypothetical protein
VAQLDEIEEVAQREHAACGDRWDYVAGDADSMLVQMMSPAAVLADIAAKRKIIERVAEDAAIADNPLRAQSASNMQWYLATRARDVLRLLASAYVTRPGYLAEWAPQ